MLMHRLATILPTLTLAAVIKTMRSHGVSGLTGRYTALVSTRLFQALHHGISDVGVIDSGQTLMHVFQLGGTDHCPK